MMKGIDMEISKKPWPILSLCGIKEKIDTNPDFQRPAVWSRAQKQLLVDTILRGYDVPKLYWRRVATKPDKYEVVDGQQRLRAIFEFQKDGYPLPKETEPLDGIKLGGLKYSDLPDDLRVNFDSYPLDIIVISDTDEDEVRDMFLRLQTGTTLKAQERRNAMPGQMRDFVRELASHKFFQNCGFSNSRYTFDLVAAQMTAIELNGGPCHVKNANLNSMYEDLKDFDRNGPKPRKIKRTLDYLLKAFPEKTPELERYRGLGVRLSILDNLSNYRKKPGGSVIQRRVGPA